MLGSFGDNTIYIKSDISEKKRSADDIDFDKIHMEISQGKGTVYLFSYKDGGFVVVAHDGDHIKDIIDCETYDENEAKEKTKETAKKVFDTSDQVKTAQSSGFDSLDEIPEDIKDKPYFFVYRDGGVLKFRSSDGRTGSEPFTSDGFERLMNLMDGADMEFRDDDPPEPNDVSEPGFDAGSNDEYEPNVFER